jgi:NADP-dependent 3-hydroxy acid dehydrogenase YdfG
MLIFFQVPKTHGVQADVSDWDFTKKVVEDIGPVDLLINNVGTTMLDNFLDVKPEDFDK